MELVQPLEPVEATLAELDALPDDGQRYELIDGFVFVTPAPLPIHQWAVRRLIQVVDRVCPEDLVWLPSPVDFRPGGPRSFQSDLVICRPEDIGASAIEGAPTLVIEVLSRSTRFADLFVKRNAYATAGVPHYWIVDPERESLLVLELETGQYVERHHAKGHEVLKLERPFPVRVVPAELVS